MHKHVHIHMARACTHVCIAQTEASTHQYGKNLCHVCALYLGCWSKQMPQPLFRLPTHLVLSQCKLRPLGHHVMLRPCVSASCLQWPKVVQLGPKCWPCGRPIPIQSKNRDAGREPCQKGRVLVDDLFTGYLVSPLVSFKRMQITMLSER